MIPGQQGVHGRGLDLCVSAKQREVKGAGGGSKASLYVGVSKVSIRRFDDEAHCSEMTRFQGMNNQRLFQRSLD